MSRSRRFYWAVYGVCVLIALVGLARITVMVLRLERAEQAARADATHQESLRLALWRMDSWVGALLAQEAARPFFEYQSYHPQWLAYTRILKTIEPGEVLSPSRLLAYRSEVLPLHFQIDARDQWSSPQVPTGNLLDLAQATLVPDDEIAEKEKLLQSLRVRVATAEVRSRVGAGEALVDEMLRCTTMPLDVVADQGRSLGQSDTEWSKRAMVNVKTQQLAGDNNVNLNQGYQVSGAAELDPPGLLIPIWIAGAADGSDDLIFVRRVPAGNQELLQGFLVNWKELETQLLDEIPDLFAAADLVPYRETDVRDGNLLSSIPAVLAAGRGAPAPMPISTPARATLAISWIAGLAALIAVGITLHASIVFGAKRSRFASTVTHELRSPLTTFRMYSEMLAKGMVPEESRQEYLATLQRESDRLSNLVENVLAYARLEEGRAELKRERLSVDELVGRTRTELEARASQADMTLDIRLEEAEEAQVETDPEALEQILFNLVDNACKYGGSEADSGSTAASRGGIELSAQTNAGHLQLRVRDRGPGVPSNVARTIFSPFDRGQRDAADPNPGVGLGLALARGLARDLGGDLRLETVDGRGACFRLELPLAS